MKNHLGNPVRNFELGDIISIATARPKTEIISAIVAKADEDSDDITIYTLDHIYVKMVGIQKVKPSKI
jgi:hypothetical protein